MKQLKKKHENRALKELYDAVNELANYRITKQRSNHPLTNMDGHIDLHLKGQELILLYKYEGDVLTIALKLQDVANHDQLNSYDRRKLKAPTREYDVENIKTSFDIQANFKFLDWYNNLSDEDQWRVDDIADVEHIPFYEDACEEQLKWLKDTFELMYSQNF